MSHDTESDNESTEAQRGQSDEIPSVSRRGTITSLLGIGGISVIGASRRSKASPPPQPRPWEQDVDAQCNDLLNLGSLTMAANPAAVADFAGQNLSIDDDGKLNASGISPWEDTDDDGLLETPDDGGIDVGEVETDQITIGAGKSVTSVWGDSGELVSLSEYAGDGGVIFPEAVSEYQPVDDFVIPFESLSFTNIDQLYLSLIGQITGEGVISVRIFDSTANTPLNSSEMQHTMSADSETFPFEGPKVEYDPEATSLLIIEAKAVEGGIGFNSPQLQVWGEIV